MRRRKLHISPLAIRIMAVNIGALMILVFGMLYTGEYERGLIAFELKSLQSEGRLLAAALYDNAALPAEDGSLKLSEDLARGLLRRIMDDDDTQVIVYDAGGNRLLDSQRLSDIDGEVEIAPLDRPQKMEEGFEHRAHALLREMLNLLPVRLQLPPYPAVTQNGTLLEYPGIAETLTGSAESRAWQSRNKRILLASTLPIGVRDKPLGAALLIRHGRNIEDAVSDVQISVLKVFAVAFLVTILLSIYLSQEIVQPILRLAEATKRMRMSFLMKDTVPDLSWRKDEIGDLSRAFRELADALAERIDTINRFASDVAHEIKNPLASVKSAVETLGRVDDPAQQAKLLSVINDDINRMNRLITDISNASRLDSELNRAERSSLDMVDLLQDVVAAERSRIGDEAGEKIDLHFEKGKKLRVSGNATQLAQVLHNLIENALSFIPPDGKVDVYATRENDRIIIHVDNPGPPIPESKLEAVFERFYSERPKSEKFGMHSGLGLSISRQIVRTHRGEITAQNLRNSDGRETGVRFTVVLPAGAGTT